MPKQKRELPAFEGWNVLSVFLTLVGMAGIIYAMLYTDPAGFQYLLGSGVSMFLVWQASLMRD